MERKSFNNTSKENGLESTKLIRGKEIATRNGASYGYAAMTDPDYAALAGFTWPPRSYTCTFCKREFRSAQALGGHMNVHRRDRARLRHSSSSKDGKYSFHNLNPKPKPIFSFGSPHPFSSTPAAFTSSPVGSSGEIKSVWGLERIIYPPFPKASEKSESILPFDLEIGLFCGSKEDLDLELRLGYS